MNSLKSIVVLLLLPFSSIEIKAQHTYVVSVGIADYQSINDLTFTEADVATFNQIMAQHDAKITTLTGIQATHANILKLFVLFLPKQRPQML